MDNNDPVPVWKYGDAIMTTERIVRAVAGTFVLASLALGIWIHPYWFFFTAFVGLNLFQSAFTQFCPLELILIKIGIPTEAERCRSQMNG